MIPDAGHVIAALVGAFRLLRFDASGFGYFDRTIDGFWRSFFCAALILPAYALLVALNMDDAEFAKPFYRIVLIKGVAYVIGWVAFPLAMVFLADVFGRAEKYVGYIVAYNWSSAPQVALMLLAALIGTSDLLPSAMQTGLHLGAMLYLLAVQWFVARRALDLGPGAALLIVALDFFLSFFIAGVASAMLARSGGA